MFQEYDCFKLRKRFGDDSIPVGMVGVVLMVLEPSVYEVEFPDSNGGNLGRSVTFTITEEFMEAVPQRRT